MASATTTHESKMKLLADERTDTEKIGDAWGIVKDKIDAATAALISQSSALKGTIYDPFRDVVGHVAGFASGGAFTVGGSGGTDSQMVAFRATPGEVVSVATPGQARGGGTIVYGGINIQFVGNAPSTPAQANTSAQLLTDALRAHGIAV